MPRTSPSARWLGLAALAFAACTAPQMPPVQVVEDAALADALHRPWLPDAAQMRWRARAVLELDGVQSTMTLLAYLRAPRSMRLVALSDTGPTQFDVVLVGGETRLERAPGLLPEAPVRALARDLAALLLPGPDGDGQPVRDMSGALALQRQDDWRVVRMAAADADEARDVLIGGGDRWHATARLEEWRGEAPWCAPARISLADVQGSYRLELTAIEWAAVDVPAGVFGETSP